MKDCNKCGVFDEAAGVCFKYKTKQRPGTEDCYFFVETEWEDGERLSPQYHMIMREVELKSKQMQGPV